MSNHLPDRGVRKAFKALCLNIDSPLARRALAALESHDWVALTTLNVEHARYNDAASLLGDLQIASFFKKYPDFDLGIDLEEKAVETFWECEAQCLQTNNRLAPLIGDPYHYGSGVRAFFDRVRKEVSRILGKCPSKRYLSGKFGPGSTYRDVGPYITVPDKMSDRATLTTSASEFLIHWSRTAWGRLASLPDDSSLIYDGVRTCEQEPACASPRHPEYVRGNRFTTVAKDAWKRRGICIEPSINVFYQLSVGSYMTMRLGKTCFWGKSFIQDYHRELARQGSIDGHLATIDLSNASDSIAATLVRLLLPHDWFELLSELRSTHTLVKNKWVLLEKFSSMGNGFTFELETVLFRAIAWAAMDDFGTDDRDRISTFGDDIIVPARSASNVIAALNFLGMKVNEGKSFVDGRFRESCGGDYFDGYEVRPHYLKESVNEPHQYIALHNGLARFGIRYTMCGGPDVARLARLRLIDELPSDIARCRGPQGLGDLVLFDDDQQKWSCRVRSGIRYFRVWRPVSFGRTSWSHFRPGVVHASALYGCPAGDSTTMMVFDLSNGKRPMPGVDTRVNGSYVKGHRFGRVAHS